MFDEDSTAIGFREDQGGTSFTLFPGKGDDDGFVGLILKDAPLIELGDSLQPGVRMTPAQARLVAAELVKLADRVEECPMHDGSGFKCALHRGHGGECMGLGELFE
jgi:hypothetical protein